MIMALFASWLIVFIIQTTSRVCLFIAYTTPEITENYKADIVRMFWTGAKYDIRVASIALALLMVLGLLFILTAKTYRVWLKIFPILASFITSLIIFFTTANIFYFKTFERTIDVFAFSIIDDDTAAILATIWQDYPVIQLLIGVCLSLAVFYWLYKRILKRIEKRPMKTSHPAIGLVVFLLITALFFLGARGSAGKFPLRRDNAQISTVQFLNNITPNAGMSLDWAYDDYKKTSKFPPATDDDGRRILSEYFETPTEPSLQAFMATTRETPPDTLETPPNVVLLLMESMGTHLSLVESPDLLGRLRPHWEEDFVFTRFLTEVTGTIGAVNRLLVWSFEENISMSKAQQTDFASNMFKPYLENGYKIIYITSGSGSWRNLNHFVPNLGVHEFIEQNMLQKLYPEAKTSPWGIPDEYMFKHIQTLLEEAEASKQPVLIFALSTTFHPPYRIPDDYTPPDFQLTPEQQIRFEQLGSTGGGIDNVFGTFRYTTDKLGDFLNWLKASPSGTHSIIAITGDHNTRSVGYPSPEEAMLSDAVPFYLYIPVHYRAFAHFDALTPGSQKDIWPTLYNISLPHTQYYKTGCDLLAENKTNCFGYGQNVLIDKEGVFSGNRYWEWQEPNNPINLLISNPQNIDGNLVSKYGRYKLYRKLLEWQTNRQVNRGN